MLRQRLSEEYPFMPFFFKRGEEKESSVRTRRAPENQADAAEELKTIFFQGTPKRGTLMSHGPLDASRFAGVLASGLLVFSSHIPHRPHRAHITSFGSPVTRSAWAVLSAAFRETPACIPVYRNNTSLQFLGGANLSTPSPLLPEEVSRGS